MNERPEPPTRAFAPTPAPIGGRRVDASIVTRESPALGFYGRSKNIPGQNTLIGCADIEAEFAIRAVIMLRMSASRGENALHVLARGDDKSEARGDHASDDETASLMFRRVARVEAHPDQIARNM